MSKMITAQAVAERKRRSARELARILSTCIRWRKQVSQPTHGLDNLNSEFFAYTTHKYFNRVGVTIEVLIVQMLNQLGTRDHTTAMMHQIGEQPVLVTGQFDRVAINRYASSAGVETHRPAVELALGMTGRSPQKRTNACEYFLEMKRLSYVVVGSSVEALHFITPAIARREHKDRHSSSGASPSLQDGNAIHFRQAYVEDDSIVGFGLSEVMAFLTIEGAINNIPGVGQRCGKLAIKIRVVLDHEEAQGTILHSRAGMKLATDGINGCVDHFATTAKQSQYIDELIVTST